MEQREIIKNTELFQKARTKNVVSVIKKERGLWLGSPFKYSTVDKTGTVSGFLINRTTGKTTLFVKAVLSKWNQGEITSQST